MRPTLRQVPDLRAEWEERHGYELDVRQPQRDPDDGDELRDRGGDVPEREPPAGEDEPQYVSKCRRHAGIRPTHHLAAEGPERVVGHPEGRDAERDRDDEHETDQA